MRKSLSRPTGGPFALRPEYVSALTNMGNVLRTLGRCNEAEASYRRAIELRPDYSAAWNALAVLLCAEGRSSEAIPYYRRVAELRPGNAPAASNLLYALHYVATSAEVLLKEHRRIVEMMRRRGGEANGRLRGDGGWDCDWQAAGSGGVDGACARFFSDRRRPSRLRSNAKRIRVGYVSPNFNEHPTGRFLVPLLEHHDPERVEVFCYSGTRQADEVTAALKRTAHFWRETNDLTDDQCAQRIREDRIDILVDLSLHMAKNRLGVFARKPCAGADFVAGVSRHNRPGDNRLPADRPVHGQAGGRGGSDANRGGRDVRGAVMESAVVLRVLFAAGAEPGGRAAAGTDERARQFRQFQ